MRSESKNELVNKLCVASSCDSATLKAKTPALPPLYSRIRSSESNMNHQEYGMRFESSSCLVTHITASESFSSNHSGTSSCIALQRAIDYRKRSLTLPEYSFLNEILKSGNETNIQSALNKLSDDHLFTMPSSQHEEDSLNMLTTHGKENVTLTEHNTVDQERVSKKEELDFSDPNNLIANAEKSCSTGEGNKISLRNVQIISGEDGLESLERYKISLRPNTSDIPDDNHANHLHVTDAFDLGQRIDLRDRIGLFGSDARFTHINYRKNSHVHGNIWKAYESGISLYSNRSRQSFESTPERPSKIKRRTSSTASSIVDLVTYGGATASALLDPIFRSYSPPKYLQGKGEIHSTESIISVPSIPRAAQIRSQSNVSTSSVISLPPVPPAFHVRTQSNGSTSTMGSLHIDWPPTRNVDGIFREMSAKHHRRSSSIAKKLKEFSMEFDNGIVRGAHIRSESSKQLPPMHHVRRDSQKSVGSIPALRRASHLRGYSSTSSVEPFMKSCDFVDDYAKTWLASGSNELKGDKDVGDRNAVCDAESDVIHGSQIQTQAALSRPVLMRNASTGIDDGIGFELTTIDNSSTVGKMLNLRSLDLLNDSKLSHSSIPSNDSTMIFARSLLDTSVMDSEDAETTASLTHPYTKARVMGKGLGDFDSFAEVNVLSDIRSRSWDLQSEGDVDHYNAWDVLIDEYSIGYGFRHLPFEIIGTCADDVSSQPHVLSPPLMESLSNFFPDSVEDENWWLKYSLVRDGASLYTMLQKIRGSHHTVIAIETSEGEVFGSFTSKPWRKSFSFFGTGESFLWRMRKTRKSPCHSVLDQAQLESEIEVFPWTGLNNCVQICTSDRLIVGGGGIVDEDKIFDESDEPQKNDENDFGLGLVLDGPAMLYGSSDHCVTFNNSPLSATHADGSPFEIANLEVWTLTPATTVEIAERLELGSLFLETNVYDNK